MFTFKEITMIKERYVNFEVASLLRDKGFDECVHAWHNVYDKVNLDFRIAIDAPHLQIPAPTQAMACDWLIENYKIYINVSFVRGKGYVGRIDFNESFDIVETKYYSCIEPVYNEALKYVLTNLI